MRIHSAWKPTVSLSAAPSPFSHSNAYSRSCSASPRATLESARSTASSRHSSDWNCNPARHWYWENQGRFISALGAEELCNRGRLEVLEQCQHFARSSNTLAGFAHREALIAAVENDLHKHEVALERLEAARESARQRNELYAESEISIVQGDVRSALGDAAGACDCYEAALTTAMLQGARTFAVRAATRLAACLAAGARRREVFNQLTAMVADTDCSHQDFQDAKAAIESFTGKH